MSNIDGLNNDGLNENPKKDNEQAKAGEDGSMNSLIPQEAGELISRTEVVTRSVIKNLIREAFRAMDKAYAPYSGFYVGAALITMDEKIYTGCNIENASYGLTSCAEQTAICKAVSEGEKKFAAIAIVGGKDRIVSDFCPPCGKCRQLLREFVSPESFLVILARSEDDYSLYSLDALLPLSFGPDNLGH